MAYETEHLQVLSGGLSNTNNDEWVLNTTDPVATALAAEYISDGVEKGLKQGNMVLVKQRASLPGGDMTAGSWAYVSAVGTGADGAAVDLTAL